MSERRTSLTALWGLLSIGSLLGMMAGCALVPPNSFLDPTKVGMFPLEYREGGIRRVLTPREGPEGLANATEPTPDDLVVDYEEYRIGLADGIGISIDDFLRPGIPYQAALEVNPAGYIRLPQLGLIRVIGMTDRELEQELRTRLQESGILPDPIVQVFLSTKRSQVFSVIGSVSRPGPYQLAQPDLRLLDVLGLVGDVGPMTKRLYVVRRTEPGPGVGLEQGVPAPTPMEEEGLVIPPPAEDEEAFESTLSARFGAGAQEPPQEAGPATREATPSPEDDFEAIIAPHPRRQQPPAEQGTDRAQRRFAPLIFDPTTGTLKEAPADEPLVPAQPQLEPEMAQPEDEAEFDWEEVPEYELSQRVIEIDVPALKSGDPRYNVVVRPRDLINVPVDTGVYYMMGEVNRPGVFAFSGREITIKQAIAATGGFRTLAWPSRCEIIRREKGTDKQITIPVNLDRIFAGLEDDLLLRDEDIVNVGTDIIAPFLFVIRNSFRFTYGFGFVYDRNFGDQDAIGARINPETLDIQRKQSQGLPF